MLDWYHVTVTDIVNKKKRNVNIKSDDDCLHENDMKIFTYVLLICFGNLVNNVLKDYSL